MRCMRPMEGQRDPQAERRIGAAALEGARHRARQAALQMYYQWEVGPSRSTRC